MSTVNILLVTLIPLGAAIVGGIIAAWRSPGKRMLSLIQHFASGVVFAGVAGEVIPDIEQRSTIAALLGFIIGVPLIIGVKKFSERLESRTNKQAGLALVTAIDLAVDGLPVGIGFIVGGKTGLILTIALSLELLSLSLAVAGGMTKSTRLKRILIASGLGGLFWVSANVGAFTFGHFSSGVQTATLAIGAVVFMYLAAEELLGEAHEVEETSVSTAVFFSGFVLLLMIEMLV